MTRLEILLLFVAPLVVLGNSLDQGGNGNQADTLDEKEVSKLLCLHNQIRNNSGSTALTWDQEMEDTAKWIIRCDIQYPGTIDDYSNYAKYKRGSLSAVMVEWAKESIDSDLEGDGCIAITNSPTCNHKSNIASKANIMGCAAKNCGSAGRQLTCVYRE